MGRLPLHDERPDDRTGKAEKGQTGQSRENLAVVDGKVIATGNGAGGQGRLWVRTASRRRGDRDRGWYTLNETAMGASLPGRGLGVPPH